MRHFPPVPHGWQYIFFAISTPFTLPKAGVRLPGRELLQTPIEMIRKIIEKWRTDNAKADAERLFNATVYHCARVSRANPSIAFEIKAGELGEGNPMIIDRPDCVVLREDEDKVIVRDGIVWSITKERP